MKHSLSVIRMSAIAGATIALLATGCSRTDDAPLPGTVPHAQTQAVPSPVPPGAMSTPTLPAGSLPDPVVPKEATDTGTPTPTPGQAGSHSSPAFKDGGKPDPNK